MTFHRIFQRLFASAFITFAFVTPSLAQQERGPSTAEERERVVQLALASDKEPIATMNSADGRWFEKWANDVPDFQFGPDAGAYWFHNGAAKGDLLRVLRFQHTLSTAAFQIQHHIADAGKKKEDLDAKTLAGFEGILRAYESLVAKRPDNRSQMIDDAIAIRNKGELASFVKKLPPMSR